MLAYDSSSSSSSSIIAPHPDIQLQSKLQFTRRRLQRIYRHTVAYYSLFQVVLPVVVVSIMFLNRSCYGNIAGTLEQRISRSYESTVSLQLKRRITQTSCGFNKTTRPYCCTIYQPNSLLLSSVRHNIAFITSPSQYHHQLQQHSFASTKTKTPRSENRWRSPVLRPTVAEPGAKRPPKIFKRLHNIRGKKNSNDDDDISTILNDGKLYRADRVLANRTGKSRKECFQLLQDRRVFMVTDELYTEISPKKQGKEHTSPQLAVDQNGKSTDSSDHNVDTATTNNNNNNDDDDDDDKKTQGQNMMQQYRLVVITGPAMKIGMHTRLRIDKYQDVPLPPPLLMVYHKPKWVLSVRRDPLGRPCLDDVLLGATGDSSTKPDATPPLHPVGRLDYDTTGLLLFSSIGRLTQALLHPKHSIEKEYVAVVTGVVNEEEMRTVLAAGVTTGAGVHTAQLVSAVPNNPPSEEVASFLANTKAGLPTDYNVTDLKLRGYLDIFDATSLSTVTLRVSEGKYRMVRRMLANIGHPVVTLHRARLGEITLGDLPVGQTRSLTATELKWAQTQLKQGAKVVNPTQPKETPTESYDSDEDEFH